MDDTQPTSDSESFLSRGATISDVVALFMLCFASIFLCLACPWAASAIDNFEPMFISLGAELPPITVMTLSYGWWAGIVVAPCFCLGAWAWYRFTESDWMKIVIGACALTIGWTICSGIPMGIFFPILELQKNLM